MLLPESCAAGLIWGRGPITGSHDPVRRIDVGTFSTSPVCIDGKLVLGAHDGRLHTFALENSTWNSTAIAQEDIIADVRVRTAPGTALPYDFRVAPAVVDLDNDGCLDIVVGSGGDHFAGDLHFYRCLGGGKFAAAVALSSFRSLGEHVKCRPFSWDINDPKGFRRFPNYCANAAMAAAHTEESLDACMNNCTADTACTGGHYNEDYKLCLRFGVKGAADEFCADALPLPPSFKSY